METSNNINKPYWAAQDKDATVKDALDKIDKYYQFLLESGRMYMYRRSWSYYYRARLSGGVLGSGGDQGELTTLSINHYRNLLSHLESMTVQQRIAFEPKATNSDVKSQSQVILASTLLDYYLREEKLERNFVTSVKQALIYGEAFITIDWDATAGDPYGLNQDGSQSNQGDIVYDNFTPIDIIRDFTARAPGSDRYFIRRKFMNKYDLSAKYPELADSILSSAEDMLELTRTTTLNFITLEHSDNIPVYTLIHDKVPALPQGRYLQFLDNGTVLLDTPLPYKKPHVYRIAADEEDGTIFGYTVGFDLLPMQEGIDILYSSAITNQSTFGVQNVLVPKGSDFSTSSIAGGLNVLEYDSKAAGGGKPEPLNLTTTPPEIFNFMNMLEKLLETISGVNSVARGNPEASLKSGAALALIQSQAIQFNENLNRAFTQIVEDVGTGTINILRDFASTPRIALICGKTNLPLQKEWQGNDLDSIDRVLVDIGSPMSRTIAGKLQIAETLMQNKLIDNADQYLQVLSTGSFQTLIEGKQADLLLIKAENEALSANQPVIALITDNHSKHILEHTVVLANPNIRNDKNNPIVVAALNHIKEHMDMMNDPNVQRLSAILHREDIPMQPPAPPAGSAAPPLNPNAGSPPQPNQPNLPNPPAGTDANSASIIQNNKQGPQ